MSDTLEVKLLDKIYYAQKTLTMHGESDIALDLNCVADFVKTNNPKCFYTEKDLPEKFIAIFSDVSGCDIYYYSHDDQYGEKMYTSTSDRDDIIGVDKMYFADAGYLWFIALPDDFEV